MNTITKIIIAFLVINCLLILSGINCPAQQSQLSTSQQLTIQQRTLASQQYILKNAAYIFEGMVTQQECYQKVGILTCSIIQITKIFKGSPQIKLGSIKVITSQGGSIGDGSIEEIVSDRGVALGRSHTYIIFGGIADSTILPDKMIATDNSLILSTGGAIVFNSNKIYRRGIEFHVERPAAQWEETQFKTLDDLYVFLKENGLTIQEEVVQPKPLISPADSTKQKKTK
jgi:hypothetical protein